MRAGTVTPCSAAMADRLSPDRTVTISGGRVVAGGIEPGMVSCWPTESRSGSVRSLAFMRAETDTPCTAAMADRLSPGWTVTTTGPVGVTGRVAPGTSSSWPTCTVSGSTMLLAWISAERVTPYSAAMPDRLSPRCTTTTMVGRVVGVAPGPGMTSRWPMKSRSASTMPLADMSADTLVPCSAAISERLSPASTVTTTSAGAGDAVASRVPTNAETTTIDRKPAAQKTRGRRAGGCWSIG